MNDANNNEHQADSRELEAVAAALEAELARLKENLETHRLLDNTQHRSVIQQLITDIDERQDRLVELQQLIAAKACTAASTASTTPCDAAPTKR